MSSIPHPEEVWMKSTMTERDLERMVTDLVLPEKTLIGWHAADGELFPTANNSELVVFEPFFYRGFSLPTNKFFRGLLHFYGIELVHLNPNSILQIATFIHLCEAFLGVEPHFALFHHLFTLRPIQRGRRLALLAEPCFSFGIERQTSIWVVLCRLPGEDGLAGGSTQPVPTILG